MIYTYYKNRECRFCKNKISDQTHALIEFCKREVMEDGSIKNCKDDYWAARRRLEDAPYRKIAAYHKQMLSCIEMLLQNKGSKVTITDIDKYGITLLKAKEISISQNGTQRTYFFVKYAFEEIDSFNFKIYKHDRG